MPDVGKIDTQSNTSTPPLPPETTKRVVRLSLDTFREDLKKLAQASGGNAELGRRLGVTGQYVDMLCAGKRQPGPKMLKAIGARRVVMLEIEVEAE